MEHWMRVLEEEKLRICLGRVEIRKSVMQASLICGQSEPKAATEINEN
jgi:hypothetical protein